MSPFLVQLVLLVVVTMMGSGSLAQSTTKEESILGTLKQLEDRFGHLEIGLRELKKMIGDQNSKRQLVGDGGWIVIQHRFDGSVNFTRNWTEYRNGFGSLDGEFWLGLENIHALTSSKNYELIVFLEDFDGVKKFARYGKFAISGENEGYKLKTLEAYSGTAGDSLNSHKDSKFSTYDRDNDSADTSCADFYKGGWWYKKCHDSNLNGLYVNKIDPTSMMWMTFNNDRRGLKVSKLMIKEV